MSPAEWGGFDSAPLFRGTWHFSRKNVEFFSLSEYLITLMMPSWRRERGRRSRLAARSCRVSGSSFSVLHAPLASRWASCEPRRGCGNYSAFWLKTALGGQSSHCPFCWWLEMAQGVLGSSKQPLWNKWRWKVGFPLVPLFKRNHSSFEGQNSAIQFTEYESYP